MLDRVIKILQHKIITVVSSISTHILLQFTSMISRVYFIADRPFFSEFFQIYMVAYGYVVSRTFEYFVVVTKICFRESQFLLQLIHLLHFFFIFWKKPAVFSLLVPLAFSVLSIDHGLAYWRILNFSAIFDVSCGFLELRLTHLRFVIHNAHLKKTHISCGLHVQSFYFIEKSFIFFRDLVIRIMCISLKVIDVFRFFRGT